MLRPHVTRIRRERRLTPDGHTVTAAMPGEVVGHFGPELRRFILFQYHQGQVTLARLVVQLRSLGLAISKRQLVRLRHLERLGLTELAVTPDPVRIATEGAVWGSIPPRTGLQPAGDPGLKAHGLLPDTVILSDARQQRWRGPVRARSPRLVPAAVC